ncbi:DNA-binding transcriptional regulator, MarR family [Rhodococcus pyridinivorans]|uniref:MarR family winged helix-turn-helix transcriptional regulator n=1 Tax=Rhodococcus pyridinivorans TaxID=103816 RepID=UPI000898F7C8|nr:MarR family transcriptional regulator [Rhodococcus pyridinivorans]SEB92255.1 DNA-binding transcriptional regulator, MarR family [Rhodococcus pyridinivorans]
MTVTTAQADAFGAEELMGEPTLLYAIKQVELAIRSRMDAILRPLGLTALQYTALTVLRRRGGLSSAELARNSFVTAQTMGEMLAALERRGLVARQVDPDNRRRMFTYLTDEALRLLDEYDTQIRSLEEQMVRDLNGRQREAFRGYLGRCRTALGDTAAH